MTSLVAAGVEVRQDDLGDVAHEHLPVGWFARPVADPGADGPRPAGDLGFAGPIPLLPLDGVEGRTVEGEAGIASQVCTLAGAGHRAEAELAVAELALDARDPR